MMFKKVRQSQGAARFARASSDYVEAPYDVNIDIEHSDTFTVNFWIANINTGVTQRLIDHQVSHSSSGKGWGIVLDTSNRATFQMYDGAGGFASVRTATATNSTGWTMITIRKDATNVNTQASWQFYINGNEQLVTIVSGTFNTALSALHNGTLRIGGVTDQFAGMYFRDLMVWKNVVLDQYQIRSLYNAELHESRIYTKISAIGNPPSYHIMQYPEVNRVSGSTYTFRNELTGQYDISGTITTVDMTVGTTRLFTDYIHRGKVVRTTNLVNYQESERDPYLIYLKTIGGGSSYSRGSSVQKMVGNGAVKFLNTTIGTGVRHTYVGLCASATLPISPATNTTGFCAGFGNANYTTYELGTALNWGTGASYRCCRVVVDFDADTITTTWTNMYGTVNVTNVSSLQPSVIFPNGEWYVIPFTFYNNDNVNYRQMYYYAWDFHVNNPGHLETNDIIP